MKSFRTPRTNTILPTLKHTVCYCLQEAVCKFIQVVVRINTSLCPEYLLAINHHGVSTPLYNTSSIFSSSCYATILTHRTIYFPCHQLNRIHAKTRQPDDNHKALDYAHDKTQK